MCLPTCVIKAMNNSACILLYTVCILKYETRDIRTMLLLHPDIYREDPIIFFTVDPRNRQTIGEKKK